MYYLKLERKPGKNQFIEAKRYGKEFHRISNQNLSGCLKKKHANHLSSHYINRWYLQSMDL